MQKVENEVFYHIRRGNHHDDKWIIGNTIHFNTEEQNYFFKSLVQSYTILNSNYANRIKSLHDCINIPAIEQNEFIEDIMNRNDDNKILGTQSIANTIKGFHYTTDEYVNKFLQFLRETILEDVRKQYYPEYPSRLYSVWLTTKENLPLWMKLFKNSDHLIFKVEATGNIIKVDGSQIDSKLVNSENYEELAKRYWGGIPNKNKNKLREEYLLTGSIKIIGGYKKIKDIP